MKLQKFISVPSDEAEQEISDLLVGHRIVDVDAESETFTLDDGTVVGVDPNNGCGGCNSGHYYLQHIAKVDNLITSVRLEEDDDGEEYGETRYKIFVIADATEINALTVEGTDGNGWYSTGYELRVLAPKS